MASTHLQKPVVKGLRNAVFLALILAGTTAAAYRLLSPYPPSKAQAFQSAKEFGADFDRAAQSIDAAFQDEWTKRHLEPAAAAPSLIVARRLSMALTGTVPSVQEIRALESHPEADRIPWWISYLFQDRRSSDYLAERLARAYVGVENGPIVTYRRRRLVEWLSNALDENRPYDGIVRALIDARGMSTSSPEVNFLTVTLEAKKGQPDDAKLAARVSRAFLGVRIDCVQCHDGKLGSQWKQKDFHQLAAFFGPASMSFLRLRDDPKKAYEVRYLKETKPEPVTPAVPWSPELLPGDGPLRERLAKWVTAPGNRPFARAMVNRMWTLMFGRPLSAPVDEIPLAGPWPPALELLADDFTAHGYDLRRLIRLIAATRVFQMDSRSVDPDHPVTDEAEAQWAAFPMTRLRPEQLAGALIQAASLTTVDAETNVLFRFKHAIDKGNFIKRFGDAGDDELVHQGGTIPQRLLLMNGTAVRDSTGGNPLVNASARIALLAGDDANAVETAYLSIFTRRPTEEEAAYFAAKLHGARGKERTAAMADLCWSLINSTEFSWNH
jgi:hypothetical protein